jgi:hypothetical protein
MIPMAHQMVGDYLVIDEAKEEKGWIFTNYKVYWPIMLQNNSMVLY